MPPHATAVPAASAPPPHGAHTVVLVEARPRRASDRRTDVGLRGLFLDAALEEVREWKMRTPSVRGARHVHMGDSQRCAGERARERFYLERAWVPYVRNLRPEE